jgi:hypothetical protein
VAHSDAKTSFGPGEIYTTIKSSILITVFPLQPEKLHHKPDARRKERK